MESVVEVETEPSLAVYLALVFGRFGGIYRTCFSNEFSAMFCVMGSKSECLEMRSDGVIVKLFQWTFMAMFQDKVGRIYNFITIAAKFRSINSNTWKSDSCTPPKSKLLLAAKLKSLQPTLSPSKLLSYP
jgi:hypothetical protein